MLVYPNAKINLGLYITEKRPDGFHNLETVFVPVPWYDALEIVPSKEVSLQISGNAVEGDPEKNLIMKVYRRMAERFALPPVTMLLHKNIPMGAGLGGGSADAAFTATTLNTLFGLGLSAESLEELVRPLGSDCAFFIRNKSTFAYGKGDQFEPISDIIKGLFLVLVYPGIHVSTALAYSGVSPQKPKSNLKESVLLPVEKWKECIGNDFEKNVFAEFPEILAIKEGLYQEGALYASMSGSGSAVFGLFRNPVQIQFAAHYSVQSGQL